MVAEPLRCEGSCCEMDEKLMHRKGGKAKKTYKQK